MAARADDPTAKNEATAAVVPAEQHVTGVLDKMDAASHTVEIAINGKDVTYDTSAAQIGTGVAVGTKVDLTYTGSKASVVAEHPADPVK